MVPHQWVPFTDVPGFCLDPGPGGNLRARMQVKMQLHSQNFTLYKGAPPGKMLLWECV
jgi:hypothetical protein